MLLCSWTRHAVSEVTVARPAHRRRAPGTVPLPGLGSVDRAGRAARGRARGVVRLHRPRRRRRRSTATTRAPAQTSLWATAPGHASRCRRCTRGRSSTPPPTARRCGCSCSSPTKEPDRAAADGPLRLRRVRHPDDARLLRRACSPGSRPAASTRSPACAAAPRRARSGTAPGCASSKQNVFDDFHAAAERLVADGWTTPAQLAISGGSNGGLLVGAALTQRPDLYAAVVCSAPLLDMVRYEQFGLGATWNDEYGSADDRRGARLAAVLLAVPPRARGRRLPGRRCSPSSTATPGSTRCTPARCAPRCSTRRRGDTPGPAAAGA